jgi:hypothetical protein
LAGDVKWMGWVLMAFNLEPQMNADERRERPNQQCIDIEVASTASSSPTDSEQPREQLG